MNARRAWLGLLALIVVVAVAAGTWTVTDRLVGRCDDDGALPASLDDDDVRLLPFTPDSPWRQPLADADLSDAAVDHAATTALRQGTPTGPPDAGAELGTWMNAEEYSFPVVQARRCDPVVEARDKYDREDMSDLEVRIPDAAAPAPGRDAHLLVVQPDGRTVVEMWGATRTDDRSWVASRLKVVDLAGSGLGPDNGVRAYGGPAIGGLIRQWEVDPNDPNYRDGVIRHPLALALPGALLRYDGGDPGYDEEGYSTMQGYVPPATEQDYDAPWTYAGPIPMGARVVLPASVDVDALDVSPEVREIARALQDYGGFVVDRGGPEAVVLYAEPSVPVEWLEAVRAGNGAELDAVRQHLVVVVPEGR